jgi:hypothetical protein
MQTSEDRVTRDEAGEEVPHEALAELKSDRVRAVLELDCQHLPTDIWIDSAAVGVRRRI